MIYDCQPLPPPPPTYTHTIPLLYNSLYPVSFLLSFSPLCLSLCLHLLLCIIHSFIPICCQKRFFFSFHSTYPSQFYSISINNSFLINSPSPLPPTCVLTGQRLCQFSVWYSHRVCHMILLQLNRGNEPLTRGRKETKQNKWMYGVLAKFAEYNCPAYRSYREEQ